MSQRRCTLGKPEITGSPTVDYYDLLKNNLPLIKQLLCIEEDKELPLNDIDQWKQNKELLHFQKMYQHIFSCTIVLSTVTRIDPLVFEERASLDKLNDEARHDDVIEKCLQTFRDVYRRAFRHVRYYMTSQVLQDILKLASGDAGKILDKLCPVVTERIKVSTRLYQKIRLEADWIKTINCYMQKITCEAIKVEAFNQFKEIIQNEFKFNSSTMFYPPDLLLSKIADLIAKAVEDFKMDIQFYEEDSILKSAIAEFEVDLNEKVKAVLIHKNGENMRNAENKMDSIIQDCTYKYSSAITQFVKKVPFFSLDEFLFYHVKIESASKEEFKRKAKDYGNEAFQLKFFNKFILQIHTSLQEILETAHEDAEAGLKKSSTLSQQQSQFFMKRLGRIFGERSKSAVPIQLEKFQAMVENGLDNMLAHSKAVTIADKTNLEKLLQLTKKGIGSKENECSKDKLNYCRKSYREWSATQLFQTDVAAKYRNLLEAEINDQLQCGTAYKQFFQSCIGGYWICALERHLQTNEGKEMDNLSEVIQRESEGGSPIIRGDEEEENKSKNFIPAAKKQMRSTLEKYLLKWGKSDVNIWNDNDMLQNIYHLTLNEVVEDFRGGIQSCSQSHNEFVHQLEEETTELRNLVKRVGKVVERFNSELKKKFMWHGFFSDSELDRICEEELNRIVEENDSIRDLVVPACERLMQLYKKRNQLIQSDFKIIPEIVLNETRGFLQEEMEKQDCCLINQELEKAGMDIISRSILVYKKALSVFPGPLCAEVDIKEFEILLNEDFDFIKQGMLEKAREEIEKIIFSDMASAYLVKMDKVFQLNPTGLPCDTLNRHHQIAESKVRKLFEAEVRLLDLNQPLEVYWKRLKKEILNCWQEVKEKNRLLVRIEFLTNLKSQYTNELFCENGNGTTTYV